MADSREAVLSRLGAKFSQTSLTALCRSLTMFLIGPAIGSASAKLMSGVYFCLARRLLMVTPLRLALFIDAQNAYRRARGRFFPNPQSNVDGQFDPVKLGQLIANRRGPGGVPCSLSDVRMYSGRPDPNRDQRTHAAHMKQSNRWCHGRQAPHRWSGFTPPKLLTFSESVLTNWPAEMSYSPHGECDFESKRTGKTSGPEQFAR